MAWDEIDQHAMLCGIAENTLRQYQTKAPHRTMIYNNIARSGEMPSMIIKHKKTPAKRITKRKIPKRSLPVFNLEN